MRTIQEMAGKLAAECAEEAARQPDGADAQRLRHWAEQADEIARRADTKAELAQLGELSASVAHEIRNPLCGILLSLEVLQTKLDPDDSRLTLLDNLQREAEKMEKVVNNLLQFARNYKPRLMRCRIADLVVRSVQSIRSHLKKKRVEVRVAPSSLGCEAEVDPQLLQQVFGNILMNAVDASRVGGAIEVTISSAGEPPMVSVSFRDDGTGMSPEVLERVFDPFFTSKPNGVGLGLSVCRKIVEAHGGHIEVVSAPGRGTTFTVIVPQESAKPNPVAVA